MCEIKYMTTEEAKDFIIDKHIKEVYEAYTANYPAMLGLYCKTLVNAIDDAFSYQLKQVKEK